MNAASSTGVELSLKGTGKFPAQGYSRTREGLVERAPSLQASAFRWDVLSASGVELACFFRQHDRYALADGISEPGGLTYEFTRGPVVNERRLGDRAHKDFEENGIEFFFCCDVHR